MWKEGRKREEHWIMILEHSFFGPLRRHSGLEAGPPQEPDSLERSVLRAGLCPCLSVLVILLPGLGACGH